MSEGQRGKSKAPAHHSSSTNRTPWRSNEPPPRPQPAPRLSDDLELDDDSDDIANYFGSFFEPGESQSWPMPTGPTSFGRPPLPTTGENALRALFQPNRLGQALAAPLHRDPDDEEEGDDGQSTPKAQSPERPTELLFSAETVFFGGKWIPLSNEDDDYFQEQLEQAEKSSGSQESEEAETQRVLRESSLSAMEESSVRERLGLRQRRREQRGLPADGLSVTDAMRGEIQAREQQQQGSESHGTGRGQLSAGRDGDFRERSEARRRERSWGEVSRSSFGTGSIDPSEELPEDQSKGVDIEASFPESAQEALETQGGFRLADLEEAIKKSLRDSGSGGDEPRSAQAGSSKASHKKSQSQLQNFEIQSHNALVGFEQFEGTGKLKQAAEMKLECEELQQKMSDLTDKYGIEQLLSGSSSPAVSMSSSAAGGPDNPERLRCAIAHTESLIEKSKEALSSYTISRNTNMAAQKEQDLKQAKWKLKELQKELALVENLAKDQARLDAAQERQEEEGEEQSTEQQWQPSSLRQAQDALQRARAQLQQHQGERPPSLHAAANSSSGRESPTSESSSSPRSVYHIDEDFPATAYSPLPRSPNSSPNASPPERWGIPVGGRSRRGRSLTRQETNSQGSRESSGSGSQTPEGSGSRPPTKSKFRAREF